MSKVEIRPADSWADEESVFGPNGAYGGVALAPREDYTRLARSPVTKPRPARSCASP
ncbi:hypothetical protein ACFWY5_32865 [Nonomuraea sp. NPDC059007]|uniref:hypothetical protein n=1 Tax=Nonomuraea sp. NPDC059007 TaxID=3346692 RepID=UPI0036A3B332